MERDKGRGAGPSGHDAGGRIEREIAQLALRGPAPVERWDPPYCGDIGLAIAADGTWFYRGSPIRRQPLARLFSTVLRRDADDRFYLVTPAEKVDVAVADAPFLAVEMEALGQGAEQALVFRTNMDEVVRAGPGNPLSWSVERQGGFKPYVRVRGRLDALLTRALAYDLAHLVVTGPDASDGIWSGGTFFPLPRLQG